MKKNDKDTAYLVGRRDLIKFSVFVGAALGLPRWKVFEVLEATGGTALAADASCAPTNRSVHVTNGVGSFAWFQLLWPHVEIAQAGNNNFAYHAPGQGGLIAGTDKPLFAGPEAPFQKLLPGRQISAFMSGVNETHTGTPDSMLNLGNNTTMHAACAALQIVNPTLVPVIAIDNAPFGAAPGAPRASRVGDADAVVDLFNSAASRAGGSLDNAQDAALFEANYKGFLALHRAAGRPTTVKPFTTGKVAANLLGKNLADQLRPTDADMTRYGINAGTQNKLVRMARALMVTAKAFKMGLTSSVNIPGFEDDPHGAFNDLNQIRATTTAIGKMYDAFLAELNEVDDPTCAGAKIGQNVVITFCGDTPKNPRDRGGWPDSTPGNTNWIYVLGAGYLRTGWHGGIRANGSTYGFDPATGNEANVSSAQTAMPAAAAVLYAVAKGDMRRVQDFYRGDIKGITVPQEL